MFHLLRIVVDLALAPTLLQERLFKVDPFHPSVAYPEFILNLLAVEGHECV